MNCGRWDEGCGGAGIPAGTALTRSPMTPRRPWGPGRPGSPMLPFRPYRQGPSSSAPQRSPVLTSPQARLACPPGLPGPKPHLPGSHGHQGPQGGLAGPEPPERQRESVSPAPPPLGGWAGKGLDPKPSGPVAGGRASWGQLGWQRLGPGTLCISRTWHQAPIPLLPWALRLVASLLGPWRGPRRGCSLGWVPGAGLLCP